MLARRYLAVSTIRIADFFAERFASTFKELIDEVRPLQSKGFETIKVALYKKEPIVRYEP